MVNKTQIAKSVVNILNNSSYMNDPLGSSRVGSFAFMPHQDMSFNRQMPKIKIAFNDQDAPDEKSMGKNDIKLNKYISLNAWIYVAKNSAYTVDSQKYKEEELIDYIQEEIENAIVAGQEDIVPHLNGFGEVLEIGRNDKTGTFIGVKPIVFRYRKQF